MKECAMFDELGEGERSWMKAGAEVVGEFLPGTVFHLSVQVEY